MLDQRLNYLDLTFGKITPESTADRHVRPDDIHPHLLPLRSAWSGYHGDESMEGGCVADDEQLKILSNGVGAWNAWRREKQGLRPDLSGVDLHRTDLTGANLHRVNLAGANLYGTILTFANLSRADLAEAELFAARLNFGDLTEADLTEANLRGASLVKANLNEAHLKNADLTHAILLGTALANVDLRQAKGLDAVIQRGPSPISTSTLQLSQGQIPDAFLKGCGLSDWEIECAKLYDPNITEDERSLIHYEMMRIQGEQPIMQHRLFISYAHKDSDFVENLEKLLDSKGVRYWRDVHDLKAGRLETQIDRGITLNPLVLLILSGNSVKSDWVEHEATSARELERKFRDQGNRKDVLCPIALDSAWKDCDWPRVLRRQIEDYNILDFSGWKDPATLAKDFAKLYDGLLLNY